MIGLVTFTQDPEQQDPRIRELELFENMEDAIERSEELMQEFIEEFDLDECGHATAQNRFAWASNGDVIWRAYIKEIRK